MPLNLDDIRPDVEDVAILERTRTVAATGMGGDEIGTFTETTRPSITEVEHEIDTAMDLILGQLGTILPTDPLQLAQLHRTLKRVVALQAAILIEGSFFREQVDEGTTSQWASIIARLMPGLQSLTGITTTTDGGTVTPVAKKGRAYSVPVRSITASSPVPETIDNLPWP